MNVKLARFIVQGERLDQARYAVLEDDVLQPLEGSPLHSGIDVLRRSGRTVPLEDVRLLCPVPRPRIFGVGLNYVAHIEESGSQTPSIPLLFMKPSTAASGPDDPIIYPFEAENLHFEAELAVVIGRTVRRISVENALDAVLGYTCANDISERVIQNREMDMGALLIGKGYDGFCPLGPVITTGLDPTGLELGARVNGELRQSSNTSDLLFSVAQLIEYLSRAITLEPGDVIITGTPSGVGSVLPGDSVEIFVEGVGVLRNSVVAEA